MTGYLQRLVASTLPTSGSPALAPVLKSASPVFEHNQLLGLSGTQPGEMDAETVPAMFDAPGRQDSSAPATALPPLEITRHEPRPVAPTRWPSAEIGPAVTADLLAPDSMASGATAPLPQQPTVSLSTSVRPGPAIVEPAMFRVPATALASERAAGPTETPAPRRPEAVPVNAEQSAANAGPPNEPEPIATPETQENRAVPAVVATEAPRAIGSMRSLPPIERARDASPSRSVLAPVEHAPDAPAPNLLEPRARRDPGEVEAAADHASPETPQAPPRITIGRVTVELVPDPAPAAKPAKSTRTAAAASIIGPLGNRRARRRLFALSRL